MKSYFSIFEKIQNLYKKNRKIKLVNPGVQKPPCLGIKRAQPQGINQKFIYLPLYTYQGNTVFKY